MITDDKRDNRLNCLLTTAREGSNAQERGCVTLGYVLTSFQLFSIGSDNILPVTFPPLPYQTQLSLFSLLIPFNASPHLLCVFVLVLYLLHLSLPVYVTYLVHVRYFSLFLVIAKRYSSVLVRMCLSH